MLLLYLFGMSLLLAFGLVVLFGPPFVPTMRRQVEAALDMLDLKPGQTLLELGSGDGRVALAAARRGLNVVGIELNPLLVLYSRLRCFKYRRQVKIQWGNYLSKPWPAADGVFTFALQRLMPALDKKCTGWHTKPTHFASFAFTIPDKKPVRKAAGVFLYFYP
jgi:hypothetical protein